MGQNARIVSRKVKDYVKISQLILQNKVDELDVKSRSDRDMNHVYSSNFKPKIMSKQVSMLMYKSQCIVQLLESSNESVSNDSNPEQKKLNVNISSSSSLEIIERDNNMLVPYLRKNTSKQYNDKLSTKPKKFALSSNQL